MRLLHIELGVADPAPVRFALAGGDATTSIVERVSDCRRAARALEHRRYDVVVLDIGGAPEATLLPPAVRLPDFDAALVVILDEGRRLTPAALDELAPDECIARHEVSTQNLLRAVGHALDRRRLEDRLRTAEDHRIVGTGAVIRLACRRLRHHVDAALGYLDQAAGDPERRLDLEAELVEIATLAGRLEALTHGQATIMRDTA